MNHAIDVTGLTDEAIAAIERLVVLLKQQATREEQPPGLLADREEWRRAFRAWVDSHAPNPADVDWSRESIYEGRGE